MAGIVSDERRHAMRAARLRWERSIAHEVQAERDAKELRAYSIGRAIEIGRETALRDPFRRAS